MDPQVWAQVLALLEKEGQHSRNLFFHDFTSPQGQTVFRLFRLYLSLLREVEQAAARPEMRITARPRRGDLELVVEDPRVSYRRACVVPGPLAEHFLKRLRELGLPPGGPPPSGAAPARP